MDGASGSGFGGVWLVDGSDAAFSSDKLRYFCQLSEADPKADPEEFIQFMRADSLPKKTPREKESPRRDSQGSPSFSKRKRGHCFYDDRRKGMISSTNLTALTIVNSFSLYRDGVERDASRLW
ncbi:unnamed protein product [Miscanthus lutarioriparius]|uniref:Uncharacterized protein n=1 Tax=Miscanthus lutarioriparius TaxID=422564 RepID=A0A811PD09_9POAL|nr:unnamed protein product [Miscanthus lutarioriparius]